jgi:hypothetical protein
VRVYDLMPAARAAHGPPCRNRPICGTVIGGLHPDTGRHFTTSSRRSAMGLTAATATRRSSRFHGETFNCPAEGRVSQGLYVDQATLNPEDGGEGRWRGGKGIRVDYRVRADGTWMTVGYTRSRIPPWGLEGGSEGSCNYVEVLRKDGGRELRHRHRHRAERGDVIRPHRQRRWVRDPKAWTRCGGSRCQNGYVTASVRGGVWYFHCHPRESGDQQPQALRARHRFYLGKFQRSLSSFVSIVY